MPIATIYKNILNSPTSTSLAHFQKKPGTGLPSIVYTASEVDGYRLVMLFVGAVTGGIPRDGND